MVGDGPRRGARDHSISPLGLLAHRLRHHPTNSFWTNPTRMEMAGLAKKWEEYTRIFAEIAIEARNRLRPESYVAGSIAPALKGETPGGRGPGHGPCRVRRGYHSSGIFRRIR